MPQFKACVIYTAQDDYLVNAGTIEEAAQKAEVEFKDRFPTYNSASTANGVTRLGTAWHHFKYVGTIQECASGKVHTLHTETEEEEA